MRILYLTNGFPWPLTSGYLRHYYLLRELAQSHQITLLSLVREAVSAEDRAPLAELVDDVVAFPRQTNGAPKSSRTARGIRRLTGAEPAVQRMKASAGEFAAAAPPDVVFFSGKQTLPVLDALPGVPVVADMCDVASVRYRGRIRHARFIEQPWNWAAYYHARRVERSIVRRAEHVFFASYRDRAALFGKQCERASVVPNGVDIDFWKRTSPARGASRVVFTGAMHYPPNVDAALYLIRKVMPLVRQSVPQAVLTIVGRDPAAELVAAGKADGVTVTGFVDDVRPYLEEASVFAAPLRFGAGIQNKVLEAMAMEVPVIASPIAADGLRTEGGDFPPVEVADDPVGFADAIVKQLIDQGRRPAPDAAGRAYVARHFVWKRSGELMLEVLDEVVNRRRTQSRDSAGGLARRGPRAHTAGKPAG